MCVADKPPTICSLHHPPADVAGGKGELAFELLNLNGLPATVLEPRPLDLQRRVKWLLVRQKGD